MKKIVFTVLLFLFFEVLFVSCTSAPIIFDKSLSDEDTATIYWVNNNVYPISYNGINIKWQLKMFDWNPIKIPAGNATFVIKGKSGDRDFLWFWDEYSFSYNFEKGKEYTIYIPAGSVQIHSGKSQSNSDIIERFMPWQ